MVESDNTPRPLKDEASTQEEVARLAAALKEKVDDPREGLKILKILDRTEMTYDILKSTKIGGRISRVLDQPREGVPDSNDATLLAEIAALKDRLVKKWKGIANGAKAKAQKEERKEAGQQFDVEDLGTCEITYVQSDGDKVQLPYMPAPIRLGDDKRDRILRSLATKLQTPKDRKQCYEKRVLLHALEVAKQLESCTHRWARGDEKKRQEKAQSLLSVFVAQPDYRARLVSGEVKPAALVVMRKEDFVTADQKREQQRKFELKMQSQRADWERDQIKKGGVPDGAFPCTKCGSRKTAAHEQPCENLDDFVDTYVECLDCNYRMKV